LAAALSALLFTERADANLLTNSAFQTGDLSGWTTYTTANGTIGSTPIAVELDNTGLGSSRSVQFIVGQVVAVGALQRGGGIFQNVFMPADDNLNFSMDIASAGTDVSGNADAGTVSLLFNGSSIAVHDFGGIAMNAIERASFNVAIPVSAGNHEIRVEILRGFTTKDGTPRIYLDNIRALTDAQLLNTPETLPLLAIMALGLWGIRHRAT